MKIHQYFSIVAALVAVLFLAAASAPTTSFAATTNSKQSKQLKACLAKVAKMHGVRHVKVSNRTFKRQIARNQSNTLQKPICVQCSTVPGPSWGTAATSGAGTGQQNNPKVTCSTCIPAWNLPATSARAPASQTASGYPVCGVPANCAWSTPAKAGTSATYTPPAPAVTTTTATQPSYRCGGLLCSILAVPYNIGAFVFGGRPISGCS